KWGQALAVSGTVLVGAIGGAMKVGALQERLETQGSRLAALESTDDAILERVRKGEANDAGVAEALRALREQQRSLVTRLEQIHPRLPGGGH
ncbi:MAG: hypothetical protein AAF447_27845, partial [Myxococcota bacterium]